MNWSVIEGICDMLGHSWDPEIQDPRYRFCEVCEHTEVRTSTHSMWTADDEETRYYRCVKERELTRLLKRIEELCSFSVVSSTLLSEAC